MQLPLGSLSSSISAGGNFPVSFFFSGQRLNSKESASVGDAPGHADQISVCVETWHISGNLTKLARNVNFLVGNSSILHEDHVWALTF
jgi:hypothetical protein